MAHRWSVLAVAAVAVFLAFLDVTIVNIAFPDLERDFAGATRAELSWVLNAYNVVFASLLIPAGRLADLVGRRRTFLTGLSVFLAASVACGLAGSVELLVAARVIQAVGAALLVPASLGLVLHEFPVALRATATSIWGAVGAVAAAVGPVLGGVLVDAGGWRWAFFAAVPVGLVAAVPAVRLLREHRDPAATVPDLLGTALLAGGVGALAWGLVDGVERGWTDPRVLATIAAAAALLVGFVFRSARHRAPVIEFGLFRLRSFAVGVTGMLIFSIGFTALLLGNVLFLTEVWDYSVLTAGVALTPGPLAAALAAPLGGRFADRYGPRTVTLAGAVLFAAGAALLAVAAPGVPDYVGSFLPAQLLSGSGVGLSFAGWTSAAVAQLPASRFATGTAVSSCLRQIGAVLGVAGLVAVLEAAAPAGPLGAFTTVWALIAGVGAAAGLIALTLGRLPVVTAPHVTPDEQGRPSQPSRLRPTAVRHSHDPHGTRP